MSIIELSQETKDVAGARIRSFVERAERLNSEMDTLKEDLKELFSECKGEGFDVPTIKKCIKARAKTKEDRDEAQMLFDLYAGHCGL